MNVHLNYFKLDDYINTSYTVAVIHKCPSSLYHSYIFHFNYILWSHYYSLWLKESASDFVGTHQFTHELKANEIASQQTFKKKTPKNQNLRKLAPT